MPELPEVETTKRSIEGAVVGEPIERALVRRKDLRRPVNVGGKLLAGAKITAITRRAKYLICELESGGGVLIHLGMTGNLRVCAAATEWRKHDHVALIFSNGKHLRYEDPRRFGLVLYTKDPYNHELIKDLGVEPLESDFTAEYLRKYAHKSATTIKQLIMNAHIVVGVGNIYASEALFMAGILPSTAASKVTLARCGKLVAAIKSVLAASIECGGTTIRDFEHDGKPGYFSQNLQVYGRKDLPCHVCGAKVRSAVIAQRATFWCPKCQR